MQFSVDALAIYMTAKKQITNKLYILTVTCTIMSGRILLDHSYSVT